MCELACAAATPPPRCRHAATPPPRRRHIATTPPRRRKKPAQRFLRPAYLWASFFSC